MALVCALSNEVPEQPCLSPVSGAIFERRLIEKYIKANGTDPVNNQALTADQLVDIKVPGIVRPKPPVATSFPALLKSLQDEWDATVLHSFTLRQQLQSTRQELSHALYQQDAACRVIARLNRELNAAREALATLKPAALGPTPAAGAASGAPGEPMEATAPEPTSGGLQQEVGLSDEVVAKLQERASALTSDRKKRAKQAPEGLATPEDIAAYKQTSNNIGLHSASIPGILAMDTRPHDTSRIITGGNDKNAVVSNRLTQQIVCTLKGHTKKVNAVAMHATEELVFTGSLDCTARVWGIESGSCAHVLRGHEAPISSISLQPAGDHLLVSSLDGYWSLFDVRNGKLLCRGTEAAGSAGAQSGLTCAQFHPDGLIFGVGTEDSVIKIWDVKERKNVADFPGHSGPVGALAFSENGYYLATAAEDSVVKLWDLRKLKNFRSISLEDRYEIKSLAFDFSGAYLAVAGTDVRVFATKTWDQLMSANDHTALATGVRFGELARTLLSCSLDRSVKLYERRRD